MNRPTVIAVLAVLCLTIDSATATDPYPLDALSEVRDRWVAAASARARMHAEIRQLEYDHVYRSVSESEGTLDFEQPDRCRLELRPVSVSPTRIGGVDYQPTSRSASITIWTGDELILIDPDSRLCDVLPLKPADRSAKEPTEPAVDSADSRFDEERLEKIRSFDKGDWFWEALVSSLRPSPRRIAVNQSSNQSSWPPSWRLCASPEEALPILLSDPDSVAGQGFKLVQWTDVKRRISAIPVTREARERYRVERIDILFDQATGLPYATRAVGEHRTVVRILKNVRINVAFERRDLFDPNLAGYTVSRGVKANTRKETSSDRADHQSSSAATE